MMSVDVGQLIASGIQAELYVFLSGILGSGACSL